MGQGGVLASWVVVSIFSVSLSSIRGQTKSFVVRRDTSGDVMCCVDRLSIELDVIDLLDLPGCTICGYHCTCTVGCLDFNFKSGENGFGHCAVYLYVRQNFTASPRCQHYQYQEVSTRCEATGNCSFPFTSNGQLHYSCIQLNNSSPETSCFNYSYSTGVWISCPESLTDFTAVNSTSGLVVPSTGQTVLLESVNCWFTIMSRINKMFPLNLTLAQYKVEFGNISSNYWLGLETMHQLTRRGTGDVIYRLRFELLAAENSRWYSEEYDWFYVESESRSYTLSVPHYGTGDAGDSLNAVNDYAYRASNGRNFYTIDRDVPSNKCAALYLGGWWHGTCSSSRLTTIDNTSNNGGFRWFALSVSRVVNDGMGLLKQCRMMIKAMG